MAQIKVFIDGSSGTCGLKINDYLSLRSDIEVIRIEDAKRRSMDKRIESIEDADITFLCLPDDAATEIVKHIPAECRVIDTSTAHRTDSDWVYGMPELGTEQRKKISHSNRVANPGCHASGFIFLVRPLIGNGVITTDYPLAATSLTGYSGGGKKMIADYEDPANQERLKSPGYYGLSQNHKHLPEMVKMTGVSIAPSFMPVVCDFYSGMLVTIPLQRSAMNNIRNTDELRKLYRDYYADSPLVHVREGEPESGFIYSDTMAKRSDVEIMVYGNDERPVVCARYDNLGKGAAGTAIQNMNIMLGFDEALGLEGEI